MIVLFTDFGTGGPYLGQMKNVFYQEAGNVPIVELFTDAPVHNPRASAYLLAAYAAEFPTGSIFVCVVDPGVGSEESKPVVVKAADRWFVGPDNGLFNIVSRGGSNVQWWIIDWHPCRLSATFHGRDVFAPVAAQLAQGKPVPGYAMPEPDITLEKWPDDLYEIIYIDHFGNAMTGVRALSVSHQARLAVRDHVLARQRTYSDVARGQAFWYENANGLVEIAVGKDRAASRLGIKVGDSVKIYNAAS